MTVTWYAAVFVIVVIISCALTSTIKDFSTNNGMIILSTIMIIIAAKARECVFTGVGLSVCLSVCLSVTTITKQVVDGFAPNFMRRFLGGNGRPSSCFVTIGRGMWK